MEFSSNQQNTKENLRRLAAQRYLYSNAKRLIAFQYTAVIFLSVLGILGAMKIGFQTSIASFIFLLIDTFLIDRFIRARLREAALIQEDFDCNVLVMEWSKTKCASKVPMEEIYRFAKRMSGNIQTQKLKTWYPAKAFSLPLSTGRIICQRANVIWNTSGRKRVSWILNIMAVITLIIVVLSGYLLEFSMSKWFFTILLPSLPFLNRLTNVWMRTRDSITRILQLQARIQEIWADAISTKVSDLKLNEYSREFQNELFDFRSREIPLFDWLYWNLRKEDEKSMNKTAEILVQEAQKVNRLSIDGI